MDRRVDSDLIDEAKRQIDAGGNNSSRFRDVMLPVMLGCSLH